MEVEESTWQLIAYGSQSEKKRIRTNKQKISNLLVLLSFGQTGSYQVRNWWLKYIKTKIIVFLANDAGPNLTKKIQDKSDYYQK